jgi:hypothetical protein
MTTPRPRSDSPSHNAAKETPVHVHDFVLDFTHRLSAFAELTTIERGQALIDSAFEAIAANGNSYLGKAATKQADRELKKVVATITREFLGAVEKVLRTRVQKKVDHELARNARLHAGSAERSPSGPDGLPVRRRTRRARPNPRLPPPLAPEQIRRDQEFVRLRALLKPVAVETIVHLPAPVFVTPPVQAQRPASPGDVLRALEKEIQNAVPTLGTLGPERCGAQIAAWTGQVRGLRDRLPPDISAAMRPAFRIFLEHLTQLRVEMEAHVVDALEPNWKAPDWDAYVEVNRAHVEERAPALSKDSQHMHHRAMLRALILPHRRNVPQQAAAIINAAAESLHPEDSLLQSAIRRHRSAQPAQPPAPPEGSPTTPPDATHVAQANSDSFGETAAEVPAQATNTVPAEPVTPENEFDSLWTK